MIFALLFIFAFLIGLVSYSLTNQWLFAVVFSLVLFIATTFADTDASEYWGITLVFGLPIVFFASLLGAYVVQLRRGEDESPELRVESVGDSESGSDSGSPKEPSDKV